MNQATQPFAAKTHNIRTNLFAIRVKSTEEPTSTNDKGFFITIYCLMNAFFRNYTGTFG